MAIYQNEQDLEDRLNDVLTNEQSYDSVTEEWQNGYNTCMDVATCCDENSAWHDNDYPDDDVEVILCYSVGDETKLGIGVHDTDEGWIIYTCEHYDSVFGWMELPDVPTDLKGQIFDESSKA